MSNIDDSDGEYLDEDLNDYYCVSDDCDNEESTSYEDEDPEYFAIETHSVESIEEYFQNLVSSVASSLQISSSLSKMLLYKTNWSTQEVRDRYKKDRQAFLESFNILPEQNNNSSSESSPDVCDQGASPGGGEGDAGDICNICLFEMVRENRRALSCGHFFCGTCWSSYLTVKITHGSNIEITCMASECNIVALEDFVLSFSLPPEIREQFRKSMFESFVKAHPLLRFCVGPDCKVIFKADKEYSKRIFCSSCKSTFCFKCGTNYHAPTDCKTIKNWMTKLADDSETANYFSAHTKDCPRCHICIEKNGGCNHMQCSKCGFDFCWMCLGDWKAHGSEYYECSRYKENPDTVNASARARAALKKYLHYYERWQNHAKSLQLEENTLEKIKTRVHKKVMNGSGTWIDWQYLLDAAALLAKCRYTLQYTYPYAYYMKHENRKELFEYQQAQLEAEIENLSWKVEHAESTDRGDLENQMYIAEKRRKTLLKDFFQS